jgi:anti-anti-sigma factor
MEFSWRIRPGSPEPTVEVAGELDVESGPYLHEQLRSIMRAHSAYLAIDLTGVTFIDCSGVSALLASCQYARALGGSMRVAGASPGVRRTIEITGLQQVLGVLPASPRNVQADSGTSAADLLRLLRGEYRITEVPLSCHFMQLGRRHQLSHSRRTPPTGMCADCRFQQPGWRAPAG